jgi:hypothetical protein
MKEEIVGGLKNALAHGSSLEEAMQTFANAGYNPSEIKEAARGLSEGATTLLHPATVVQNSGLQKPANQAPSPRVSTAPAKKKNKALLITILIIVLLLLVGAIISVIFFSDKITEFLSF